MVLSQVRPDGVALTFACHSKAIKWKSSVIKQQERCYMPGVYLLHDPATSFLKIGRATNLDDRLANLRTANPRLVLLEWIETQFESSVESYVHNRLSVYRREGEFFEVTPEHAKQEIEDALTLLAQKPDEIELQRINALETTEPARGVINSELELINEILKIRAELQKLSFKEGVLIDRLKISIGASSGLEDWATFNPVERQTIDVQALRREYPGIADRFSVRSTSRTLRIQPFIRQRD
jgi:hypothetical protein